MTHSSEKREKACIDNCSASYRKCIDSGEHESVCKMKRVPCLCKCSID
ncbi:MAG: hypothetical protein R2941_03170 [Desulfobacterales bacterium]